ncbi:hypothetical protein Tco_0694150 [Tanacetum coccineum]
MKTPPLDQTEGRKEGNLVKMLNPLKIKGLRKRSLQAPPKTLPNHNISLPAIQEPEQPPTPNPDWSKRQQVDFRPPQIWISQAARAEEPPTSFDEFNDTSFDFSSFALNRLKILNLTQEILVGSAFNLLKGTYKSITELEYHLEECSKATIERLDWHNLENKPYPFDLRKLLPLIQDHQGRQIIPKDYLINKDLEYLKGGDLITRLTIMKKYDYGHLEEIEVRQDDQQLYTFKESDFKRLRLQDIKNMLLLLVQQNLTNLTIDERYDLNVALRYRQAALSEEVDTESRNVRWWKDIRERSQASGKDNMTLSYFVSTHFSQNWRDLPRDIPLDSVVVLRYEKRSKSENKGKVPIEMELVLEQTQQVTSYEVLVSAEGVEE